jgi:hypothetical protein
MGTVPQTLYDENGYLKTNVNELIANVIYERMLELGII